MTDNEISYNLALAIGWKRNQIGEGVHHIDPCVGIRESLAGGSGEIRNFYDEVNGNGWCVVFDYMEWNIAAPVAVSLLGVFPVLRKGRWVLWLNNKKCVEASTPQKAIALAAIQFMNKRV